MTASRDGTVLEDLVRRGWVTLREARVWIATAPWPIEAPSLNFAFPETAATTDPWRGYGA